MSEHLDDDPFWSVVRRRHPDLDIVVLPPAPAAPTAAAEPQQSPESFAQLQLATIEELWATLVGHGMPRSDAQWIPGPTPDSARCAITLTVDEVDSAAGLGHLREALTPLKHEGWSVFRPPTGMPRIMADRPGELGDANLLFGYAPDQRRLFARLTSTGLLVGSRKATELIGGMS